MNALKKLVVACPLSLQIRNLSGSVRDRGKTFKLGLANITRDSLLSDHAFARDDDAVPTLKILFNRL
jgi:hypothetical protein